MNLPHLLQKTPDALTVSSLLTLHGLQLFYGDLHNHTSYSDGVMLPADALRQMRARGLHFAAITDHGEFFDHDRDSSATSKWLDAAQAVEAAANESFVAMRGFEWTSPRQGHSNVWCSTEPIGYLRTGDDSITRFYSWLVEAQAVTDAKILAGFNHPGRERNCFDDCMFVPELDERLVMAECFNRGDDYSDGYFRALDQGWHVGAIGCADHHGDDWGNPAFPRSGVLAQTLTLDDIQAAILARRVFATRSPTLALVITGNAAVMGSRLTLKSEEHLTLVTRCCSGDTENLSTSVDRLVATRIPWTHLELFTNGGEVIEKIARQQPGQQDEHWSVTIEPQNGAERWFVVRVLHENYSLAYSSPIWARWLSSEENWGETR